MVFKKYEISFKTHFTDLHLVLFLWLMCLLCMLLYIIVYSMYYCTENKIRNAALALFHTHFIVQIWKAFHWNDSPNSARVAADNGF